MIFSEFQDKKMSLLGFGAMRLPTLPDGAVDEAQVERMVAYAMDHGVNYFDTAWPYHNGESESVLGRVLSKYPRESFYLADKFPGHQHNDHYDPAAVFEKQLQKCGVEYFDFYLLHNVYERSMSVYLDPQWGILDYFREQKKLGRIKHLGFSTHANVEGLKEFLDIAGEDMEFCQIQLNYLDWTLQNARGKYDLLTKRGIPVWVMEPVRGGKLVTVSPSATEKLRAARPDETTVAWCFRFLQGLPNVKMILSGMSNEQQIMDNIATFEESRPLSPAEGELILKVADELKGSVPCTGCRYCVAGCPMGLDIPFLLSVYNDLRYAQVVNTTLRIEALPESKKPDVCVGCGKCSRICPQNIDIPGAMQDFCELLEKVPSWEDICRERAAIQPI